MESQAPVGRISAARTGPYLKDLRRPDASISRLASVFISSGCHKVCTKSHGLGGFNNRSRLSHSTEAGKSKMITVLANSASEENSLVFLSFVFF